MPAALLAAALATSIASRAFAFVDTHLNEIPAPVAAQVDARIAVLEGLPSATKAEKKELKALRALDKKLAKTSVRLSKDFGELKSAASAVAAIRPVTTAFDASLDEGLRRAGIALQERDNLTLDHRALVASPTDLRKIDAARSKAVAARTVADAATDRDDRARLLAKAEVAGTTALTLAEKLARRSGQALPPPRLRSGDVVGAGGGRVAVPRGTGTDIDGASVLIPPGAVASQQTVTLTEGASFVAGRDLAAGRAVLVRLTPGGVTPNGPVTVFVPFSLDGLPGTPDAADLTLFRNDSGTGAPLTARTLNLDGTVSAASSTFGTFQPGVQAPPVGEPDGKYVVHLLAVVHATGQSSGTPPTAFDPSFSTGVIAQEITFRRDRTGSASSGGFSLVNRAFQRLVPHHADVAAPTAFGSYEFLWTAPATGQFSFTIPLQQGQTALATGAASSDGNVVVFTGRGSTFDFFAVGLRSSTGIATADLEGRWTGAEFGVHLLEGGTEPFRTRWTGAARDFDASAGGVLTFASTGTRFTSDTEYRTLSASPIHVLTTASAADSGAETLIVSADGRLSDAAGRVRGLFAKDQGALVLAIVDPATKQATLMFAARQAASVPAGTFVGTWNVARFEAAFTTGSPDTRSSTQELLARTGTFSVTAGGDANDDLRVGTNAVYAVNGALPLGSMTWTIAQTTAVVAARVAGFPLALDTTGGNHRPAGAPLWLSVSGDGTLLLGTVPGTGPTANVGIVVGVR